MLPSKYHGALVRSIRMIISLDCMMLKVVLVIFCVTPVYYVDTERLKYVLFSMRNDSVVQTPNFEFMKVLIDVSLA